MLHKELAQGRWATMTFAQQMANIGSEISRASKWLAKNNMEQSTKAYERALELIDLTIMNNNKLSTLKELCRLREDLNGIFLSHNAEELQKRVKYFDYFIR
ncbi:MAG: hypothetical protein LBR28_06470 [Bacteroidales bacterium]|jgi:hypothetical protein|nr:hypothetical protein [Bacteroidales bacterium]